MKRPAPRLLLSVLSLALLSLPLTARAELGCNSIEHLTREFLRHHVSQRALGADIESRAIDTYLVRLDTSRSLLLDSEVEALRESLAGVFERIRGGSCTPISAAHQKLVARQQKATQYVSELVASPEFTIDETVELLLDPEERGYPENVKERDELWRRLVHFQLSNYVGAGETLAEAKRLLVQRYERNTRRRAEVGNADVLSTFLDSFAAALDPHSNYFTPEAVEDFRISMSLRLEGIGVALTERDGYSVVDRIIPGGAADRLEEGLLPKDKIIAVAEQGQDPVNIIDMPLREAVSLIRGKAGTTVRLTVLRQDEETRRFPMDIVRDKIDLTEQAASLRFEERERDGEKLKLAILDLPSFYGDANPDERQSTDDVERLLAEANQAGAHGLLLDLSRNGGGLLDHAVRISGYFIRKGEIVGVQSTRAPLNVLEDRDERILYTGPMVVHVSRISASASEILAGALKDYRRAVVTGDDHTFGKGTVQTVQPLSPDLGALKITTARFFRPGGRSTQRDGVSSDVVIPSLLASGDIGERHQRYALEGEQIAPFFGSLANAIGPEDRSSRVPAQVVGELVRRSSERIAESEGFQEVQSQLEEAESADGLVKLADIIKAREEAENGSADAEPEAEPAAPGGDTPAPAEPEEETNLQVEEALEVLADLIVLTRPQGKPAPVQTQASNL